MYHIYIVANFCLPFDGRTDGRFLYLAEMLAKDKEMHVELITSDFSHATKKYKESPQQEAYKTKLAYCHEPGYMKHASLRRLWSHYVWGKNVGEYVRSLPKPDCIYCAIPSLTAANEIAEYCKCNGVKLVIDVQDLWPEATFMLIKNKILQKVSLPMTWYVNRAYREADAIIAVSQTYVNRALSVNYKNPQTLTVFLGNDGTVFDDSRNRYKESYNDDIFRICYIGTLSYSYDIKCVIDAIEIVRQRNLGTCPIRFIVMGDGPLRQQFENYASTKNVDCEFTGRLPYKQMVGKMCSCDVVVNPIVKGAAQSITNKVGDYALSGLPVINTQECLEYRNLIEVYGCGINCRVGNASDVADAIERLFKDNELCRRMGEASRKLGVEKFNRQYTYQQIVFLIKTILAKSFSDKLDDKLNKLWNAGILDQSKPDEWRKNEEKDEKNARNDSGKNAIC